MSHPIHILEFVAIQVNDNMSFEIKLITIVDF